MRGPHVSSFFLLLLSSLPSHALGAPSDRPCELPSAAPRARPCSWRAAALGLPPAMPTGAQAAARRSCPGARAAARWHAQELGPWRPVAGAAAGHAQELEPPAMSRSSSRRRAEQREQRNNGSGGSHQQRPRPACSGREQPRRRGAAPVSSSSMQLPAMATCDGSETERGPGAQGPDCFFPKLTGIRLLF